MRTLREILIDALMGTHLYEMAENQSKCENNVKSQCKNLLENLILLNYFKISKLPSLNINHWKTELCMAIYNAGDFQVKKDKSIGRRERLIKRAFDERDMTDARQLERRMEQKMDIEEETQYYSNPNSKEWLGEAIVTAINQMSDIQKLIAYNSWNEIKKWVNNIF